MATLTISYSPNTPITMNVSNLATSSTFVLGRQSNQIDNTTDNYVDAVVSGTVSVGTTPTTGTFINLYVWGADSPPSSTPLANGVINGADSTITLGNTGVRDALRLGASINVPVNTTNFPYTILPFSVASLFGGIMPKFWGLFLSHNTAVNLRSDVSNVNSLEYVGIKYINV